MSEASILQAIRPVVEVFNYLGIPYHIGGSVASSTYGLARTTIDVDLVAKVEHHHIPSLVQALQPAYYIDAEMIAQAIEQSSSFNLVHLTTMLKVDVFIPTDTAYARQAFQRRRLDRLAEDQEGELYLATPEDIVLNKLEWFHKGGEISERQWGDAIGVLKVQGESLDRAYLRRWAVELGLADLLEKALQEAGR